MRIERWPPPRPPPPPRPRAKPPRPCQYCKHVNNWHGIFGRTDSVAPTFTHDTLCGKGDSVRMKFEGQ